MTEGAQTHLLNQLHGHFRGMMHELRQ